MLPPVTPRSQTDGVRAEPLFIRSVVAADGNVEESAQPTTRAVLDPRVAYLVTSLMEDVINHGTGFPGPAAWIHRRPPRERPALRATVGSPDTHRILLCVVWVGFRRQSRPGSGRWRGRRADLGRIHEARGCAADVSQYAIVRAARGNHRRVHRSAERTACNDLMSRSSERILHRRKRTNAILPTPRRPERAGRSGAGSRTFSAKGTLRNRCLPR